MGIQKDIFIEEVPLDLLCGICSEVLNEPVQVHCGEDHIFCRVCILQLVTSQNQHDSIQCPICTMTMNASTFQPSKFVQRQLGRLAVKCQYHFNGCPWTGQLSSDHMSECSYSVRPCSNAEHGCTQKLNNMAMLQHEKVCDYLVMNCPNGVCNSSFLRKDISQHESICPSYPCKYADSGCPYKGTVPEVDNHCHIYCGRLHEKIRQLQQECIMLAQQLELKNMLQPLDRPMDMDHNATINQIGSVVSNENVMDVIVDKEMSGLEDPISHSGTNDSTNNTSVTPTKRNTNQTIASSNDSNRNSSPTATPPKRTPKGKRIKYSKNTKLAHDALRASRASKNAASPTTSTVEELQTEHVSHSSPRDATTPVAINDAPSPATAGTPTSEDLSKLMNTLSTTSQHAQSPLTFNTPEDIANFFNTLPLTPSHHHKHNIEEDKHQQSDLESLILSPPPCIDKSASSSTSTAHSQSSITSDSLDNTSATITTKLNPMFALASSYLSNYQ